jgi:hypothetical protein
MIALPSFTDCSLPCPRAVARTVGIVGIVGAWSVAYATTIVEDIES